MKSSIVSIGTELLFGQIVNTNAVYLSQQLNELGFDVYYHFSVGDNAQRLKDILEYALERSDLLITTGGLGPTQDDLTKETIAQLMGKKLEFHEPSYQRLSSFFKQRNREMSQNNLKQVYLPQDCIVLQNDNGTAPGFIVENDNKIVISLPGPPKEMQPMFENYVKSYLQTKSNHVIYSKILRFFGIGESALETELLDLISSQVNPTIATYAKEGEVSIRISAKAKNENEAQQMIDPVVQEIKSRLQPYLYSENNEELVEVVAKKLLEKNITISLAESCTGGLIASALTSVPGISKCFDRAMVTYSNISKVEQLGINPSTLEKFGAVSEETAKEMVIGLKQKSKSDLCLAITGIAGPDGGSPEKPVGLVYISLLYQDHLQCNSYRLIGTRERIRRQAVLFALNMIRNILN